MAAVKFIVRAICLALVFASMGCSQSDSSGTGGEGGGDETVAQLPEVVEVSHTYFRPSELSIGAGDTVIFRNLEAMSHPLVNEEVGLHTGAFTKGERSFLFNVPGTFTVTNIAHGTTFTITVQVDGP